MERLLISRVAKTANGRIEMYSRNHRWPDLLLFEASDLFSVGINPTKLEVGVETPCRF